MASEHDDLMKEFDARAMPAFVKAADLDRYLVAAVADTTSSGHAPSATKAKRVLERVLGRRLTDEGVTQYRPRLHRLVVERVGAR